MVDKYNAKKNPGNVFLSYLCGKMQAWIVRNCVVLAVT